MASDAVSVFLKPYPRSVFNTLEDFVWPGDMDRIMHYYTDILDRNGALRQDPG